MHEIAELKPKSEKIILNSFFLLFSYILQADCSSPNVSLPPPLSPRYHPSASPKKNAGHPLGHLQTWHNKLQTST